MELFPKKRAIPLIREIALLFLKKKFYKIKMDNSVIKYPIQKNIFIIFNVSL